MVKSHQKRVVLSHQKRESGNITPEESGNITPEERVVILHQKKNHLFKDFVELQSGRNTDE